MGVDESPVSSSGRMSLPAGVRRRWDLADGGLVEVLDLGFGVLVLPRGGGRALFDDLVSRDQHGDFVHELGDDPDLATT